MVRIGVFPFLWIVFLLTLSGCPIPVGSVTANFDASPKTGEGPLTVSFQNLTDQGGGTETTWFWAFGDGTTSEERNPVHTFLEKGKYTVTFTAMNSVGTDTETKVDFITVLEAPRASFVAQDTSGVAPLPVQFTDTSSPGTSTISSWEWDFGDGEASTVQNPVHIYSQPGVYTVSLTITSTFGTHQIVEEQIVTVFRDIDYHTEVLENASEIDGKQILFVHSADENITEEQYYSRIVADLPTPGQLPNQTDGGVVVEFPAGGGSVEVTLDEPVMYYGALYNSVVVGSDGTVGLGQAGGGNRTLAEHFFSPQISLLPVNATLTGTVVTVRQDADEVVVTFDNVIIGTDRDFTTDNAFQIEFFKSSGKVGDITLSYANVMDFANGIVGLSNGQLAGATEAEVETFLVGFGESHLSEDSTKVFARYE